MISSKTLFWVRNTTSERLLISTRHPELFGILDPGTRVTVGPGLSSGCKPVSPETLTCLRLYREIGGEVVFQITPKSRDRWVLQGHPARCVWEYELVIEGEDLSPVPYREQCSQ